jgi:hypothetical protein
LVALGAASPPEGHELSWQRALGFVLPAPLTDGGVVTVHRIAFVQEAPAVERRRPRGEE